MSITESQHDTLEAIGQRYVDLMAAMDVATPYKKGDVIGVIESVSNHCSLDLDKLLAFDNLNFIHDVGGMFQHAQFPSGKLLNCFLPRCYSPTA